MGQNNDPARGPIEGKAGARPASGIIARLSQHEKSVRDQELILSAEKYFGGLSEEERLLLGLNEAPVRGGKSGAIELKACRIPSDPIIEPVSGGIEERLPHRGSANESPTAISPPAGSAGAEWFWAGLTVLVFAGVAGWVLWWR